MKPLIGIITYTRRIPEMGNIPYHVVYAQNAVVVEEAGGLPVLIPSDISDESLQMIYERLDGILLPGGGDIDPARYQQEKHPTTKRIIDSRDHTEITLARWAIGDDRPILGICRGVQVMNVAMGGTLIQDIPSQVETDLQHDIPNSLPRSTRLHDVEIDPSSRLANILGTTKVHVNSLHHQSVAEPAPNINVTAYSDDGVIEALELPDKYFAIGVQWHPEDMPDDEYMQLLFKRFIEAAKERMALRYSH